MSKLEIKLDNYKEFFHSEHGLKLITEIIETDDYDATAEIAKWKKCASKVLDKIAIKYMVINEVPAITKNNWQMLERVVENPKISVSTLCNVLNFTVGYLKEHSYFASEVLEEIAESEKLTENIAWTLYKVALENDLKNVIKELAKNKNTPDGILYDILDLFETNSVSYQKASGEIIIRYKNLREQLSKQAE